MSRKIPLSAVVLSTSAYIAFAADIPSRRTLPVYIPPPMPVFTWTGFYLCRNAGYAFDAHTNVGGGKSNGFTGGGQIGCNQQIGNFPLFSGVALAGRSIHSTTTRSALLRLWCGVEYAIPTASIVDVFHLSAVTLKAEYLHYDLGRTHGGGAFGSTKTDGNNVAAVLRSGSLGISRQATHPRICVGEMQVIIRKYCCIPEAFEIENL